MDKATILTVIFGAIIVSSFALSPKVRTTEGFFHGVDDQGRAPGVWTLTLSQVTTWIFARSLLNAAILGYFYGIVGTLAYAIYYLSFVTGGLIVDKIRFGHGYSSVQKFLDAQFGHFGRITYNFVIAIRLLSEVFANILVIGLIFGAAGSAMYNAAVVLVAVLTLGYSLLGGLRSSLRTDIVQAGLLIVLVGALVVITIGKGNFSVGEIAATTGARTSGPGRMLLAVAFLQVVSYPVHDPVMMDRGFISDRNTTRRSFFHAAWISMLVIIAFGVVGVYAGLNKAAGEDLTATLTRLLGDPAMVIFNVALFLSAISTLDSTFASAAKLAVVDMEIGTPTVSNGRWAMIVFLIGGLIFAFGGSKDLFAAVAVSGTASMFLAPVIVFCLVGGRRVARWAYGVSFAAALAGSALYLLEEGRYVKIIEPLLGVTHNYGKLLVICVCVLVVGFGAFAVGIKAQTQDSTAESQASRP